MSDDPTFAEASELELMRRLLAGELTVEEAASFLGEPDLWAVPGVEYRRFGNATTGFTMAVVVGLPEFESWVRRRRPALIETAEAAVTLRKLTLPDTLAEAKDDLLDTLAAMRSRRTP